MTTRAEILEIAGAHSLGPGPVALAVDVGGTGLKAALFDSDGRLVDARTAPTPDVSPPGGSTRPAPTPGDRGDERAIAIVEAIGSLREVFARDHPAHSIETAAVVAPGIVDELAGVGIFSANLGWDETPLATLLRTRLGVEVAVSHDVRSAGRAEFEFAESMPEDAALITIGTGIAGALRIEGRMVSAGGYAGEVGFVEVAVDTADGPFRGPAEHIASAAAIARRYSRRSGKQVSGSLEVITAMRTGDPIAGAVFAEAVDALGAMCAELVTIIAPEAIVFGGGLAGAEELLAEVDGAMRARLRFHRVPQIRRAGLGPVAGLIGAGLLTRRPA